MTNDDDDDPFMGPQKITMGLCDLFWIFGARTIGPYCVVKMRSRKLIIGPICYFELRDNTYLDPQNGPKTLLVLFRH